MYAFDQGRSDLNKANQRTVTDFYYYSDKTVVGPVGLEPTTQRLSLVGPVGIEPNTPRVMSPTLYL